MKLKNFISFIFICSILLFSMTSCKKTISIGLTKDASPYNSALTLYTYDGDKILSMTIYDTDKEQEILSKLDAVQAKKAKSWTLEDITMPLYGLEIGSQDGMPISIAWSNDYLITQDGSVYSFDFDFAELWQDYSHIPKDEFSSFVAFPCAYILSQDENGWSNTLLTPANEPSTPSGITMELETWKEDSVTVSISNESGSEWFYGEYYMLSVLINDVWYEIPTVSGGWCFNDIGFIIRNGEKQSRTYNLSMYGNLPAGTYRLISYNLFVEGIVEP